MIKASKTLMVFEGFVLAYLSMLGMLLILGGSIPFLSGATTSSQFADFFTSLLLFVFLLAGWRIYFWVLLGNPDTRGHLSRCWLVSAVVGACVCLLSWPVYKMSEPEATNIWYMQSQLFMLGLYFLPTAAHLVLHICIEINANKSMRSDAASGAGHLRR